MTYTVEKIEGIGNDSGSVRGWLTEAGWVEMGKYYGDVTAVCSQPGARACIGLFRDENEK
jgi:hypothetical protein